MIQQVGDGFLDQKRWKPTDFQKVIRTVCWSEVEDDKKEFSTKRPVKTQKTEKQTNFF